MEDLLIGPQHPRSSVVMEVEEAAAAFRVQTQLPLDDVLAALGTAIPRLIQSALHRCPQRHTISQLPRPKRQR